MPQRSPSRRLEPVDAVRGLIMVVMALDHVRDFFGSQAVSPTNLATTTVALFFTRWVTHICAPVFFLLTGTGAFLRGERRRDGLPSFLVTRGLWLIALELVVVKALMQFNLDYRVTVLTVLWALGWSMIVLASLVRLPVGVIGAAGVIMIGLHNLLDRVAPPPDRAVGVVWTILHRQGFLLQAPHAVLAAYPIVPWIGVTAVGYALGAIYRWDPARRRAWLLRAGVALSIGFVLLRAWNVYGDPAPWAPQRTPALTVVSFLNATKYPPSLVFLLMTLGPAALLLRAFDRGVPRLLNPLTIIGRVPLFYFLTHLGLIHLLVVAACAIRFGAVHWAFESPTLARYPFTQPPGWPSSLPIVYAIWCAVVIALYPLCRWFARVKARRTDAWLSYL